ncbi:MAG: NUDIX domain-containing protein [Thermoflexia bacterium]|nr:MAG: NUDIX domain-containing protein [Thermoflexia bacterium]
MSQRFVRSTLRRLFLRGRLLHPVWRGVIFLVALFAANGVLSAVLGIVYFLFLLVTGRSPEEALVALQAGRLPRPIWLGTGLYRLAVALGLALGLGRLLDQEPPETMGLAPVRWARDGGLGLLFGAGTMLAVGGTLLALSPRPRVGAGGAGTLSFAVDVLAFLTAAAAEEVVFRGYLQRLFSAWKGPAVGIAVSSVLFAVFHMWNPHITPLALVNIGLAGVAFALAVEWTGTLWLATGYHFAWNLFQGSVLGLPVSGMAWEGLLTLPTDGPALLTGGSFGPEGGLLATAVLLLSLIPLRALTRRPATVAIALQRQRAQVERQTGPLPYRHHSLRVGPRFFQDARDSILNHGNREGEVVLVLRRPDGLVLLHNKSFYPDGVHRLPSGGIRRGETVLAAVARETAEETGLVARNVRPLGVLSYRLWCGRESLFFHSWLVEAEVEGDPCPNDDGERIVGFRWVEAQALPEVAAALRALPPEWADWGRFRALAHDAARIWSEKREQG